MAVLPAAGLVIVDWRNLVKNISHSIRSASVACSFPTEPEEISHRVMKRLFCLRADHPYCKIVLANDRKPYWREKFMADWYNEHKLEPVVYKGNRALMSWQFATSPEDMEKLYRILLDHGAKSIGAFVIQEPGLEADDIWGVLAKTYRGKVLGYSADSDWSQCLSEMVMQYNFTIDEMIEKKKDIRVKWLGGDPGDNIPGIPAFKKNGERSKNNVGQTTATKMLENENWADDLHPDAEAALERNWMLTTLPCPGWDLDAVALEINELTVAHEQTDEFWQRYGITQPVRKHLQDRANRDAWISKLRLHLLNQVVPEG